MSEIDKKAVWPGWETVRLIGRGSFGGVYEIRRDVFGETETAALKVISIPQNGSDIDEMRNDGYDDESITSTFKSHLQSIVAEYSLMRKLKGHANVVYCDDVKYVQHEDGFGWDIYIKMELLTPMTKALPADPSEETVVKFAKDMCRALVACKKHGIIHRDIKPQNIFISEGGDFKLGDFGIAKTVEKTSGGTKIGTYKYMAPEVFNNQPYGAAADQYSLGLVLYWMLNERRMPFLPLPPQKLTASMDEEAKMRRLNGEPLPPPAHGSEALKAIVLKACAYNQNDRFASAEEMLAALEGRQAAAAPVASAAPQRPVAAEDVDEGTVGVFSSAEAPAAPLRPVSPEPVDEGTVGVFAGQPKKPAPQPAGKPAKQPRQKAAPAAPAAASAVPAAPAAAPAAPSTAPAAPAAAPQTAKKKKKPIWLFIAAPILLLFIILLASGAFSGGNSGEVNWDPIEPVLPGNTDDGNATDETAVRIDYGHDLWVAHGQYLLSDGTPNDWNGKDAAVYEASALTPASLSDVKLLDNDLYTTLYDKNIKYLYIGDVILGTVDAGWTANFMASGVKYTANGSYALKVAKCYAENEGDGKVYSEDQWISDPYTAYTESLTPDTLFMPPWQEELDENGFSWSDNPVATAGPGLYTVVVAEYWNLSGEPQYGMGLVLKESYDGLEYQAW